MKLSDWAKKNGISYKTAWRWFKDGKLPVEAEQMPSGTIIVKGADDMSNLPDYYRTTFKDMSKDMPKDFSKVDYYTMRKIQEVMFEKVYKFESMNSNQCVLLFGVDIPQIDLGNFIYFDSNYRHNEPGSIKDFRFVHDIYYTYNFERGGINISWFRKKFGVEMDTKSIEEAVNNSEDNISKEAKDAIEFLDMFMEKSDFFTYAEDELQDAFKYIIDLAKDAIYPLEGESLKDGFFDIVSSGVDDYLKHRVRGPRTKIPKDDDVRALNQALRDFEGYVG